MEIVRPGGGQFNPERFQANMIKRMESQMAELLKEYDKNQDGTLDAEEKAFMEKDLEEALKKARLANTYQRIKVIDVDGDLKFSDEEKEKAPQRLREDMQKRGPGRGGFGGPGFGPRDGNGPRGGQGPRRLRLQGGGLRDRGPLRGVRRLRRVPSRHQGELQKQGIRGRRRLL